MDQQWLTSKEVAEVLRLDVQTIQRWLRSGKLDGRRISTRAGWRIPASEVERVLGGGAMTMVAHNAPDAHLSPTSGPEERE